MKILLALIFTYCYAIDSVFAQKITTIDPSLLEVEYVKRMVTDTLDRENDFREERMMVLRIGKKASTFFSKRNSYLDSLAIYNRVVYGSLSVEERNTKASKEREQIFKNWPEGKVSVYNSFGLSHHTYTEDWEKPLWQLCDSTLTILGYECSSATCFFRGRQWFAFFTPEIPMNDGPWKLCGLPGLILKAFDMKGDYCFTAYIIRFSASIPPVALNDYWERSWEKKSRDRYYKDWFKAIHEDLGYKLGMAGIVQLKNEAAPNSRKLPHRNYDFEETSYPH